jgi:phasin family protein
MEDHTNMAVKKTPKSAARTAAKPRAAARKTAAPNGPAASEVKSGAKSEAKAQVDRALSLAKRNVEQTSAAAFDGYDELAVLGRGNFDAFVQSNSVVARGFEAIGMEVLACAQRSVEENMAQARALIGAKDLQEFVDLQSDFAKRRLERVLAETAKLTELSTKVANEAMEPLQKRVDATVDTVLKSQAA